jgi:ORF6N domain-containing protein
MFQLTREQAESLKFQIGTSKNGRGGRRTAPYVFTEQGIAMLSSVLHSDRAADVNVAIMRTFVRLREILATHKDLARKVEEHDRQIAALFSTVQKLLASPEPPKKNPIGYIRSKD